MIFWLCFPVLLFISQMASSGAQLSSALAELNEGHVLGSIERFREILRTDPANAAAYFYLSTLYTQMGELGAAENYLRRAMELNPGQGAHYYQLGLIRYRQKQWRTALESFEQALQSGMGNNQGAVWRSIGDARAQLFDRDGAREAYETALRIQPNDAATHLALGRFYLERNEPAAAITHLQAAVEANPPQHAAFVALGLAYRRAGDLTAAITVLTKALAANPADQDSRYALGQALLAAGRLDDGRKQMDDYEKIRRQVATADGNYDAALSRLEAGKSSEAEQLLREAVRLAPKYGPALYSLGALLIDRGHPEEAVEFLKRSVEVNPLNAEAWFSLGRAYLSNRKWPEALQAAKRAVVLNEDKPEYQSLLRDVEAKTGK